MICGGSISRVSKPRFVVLGTKGRLGPTIPDNAVQDMMARPSATLAKKRPGSSMELIIAPNIQIVAFSGKDKNIIDACRPMHH
jgi:hypothetical protein